ncbi:phage tail-type lysozyme domain-containing protein [Fructobacillus sp. M158]|uniref:phage tail tip lysozyme n=1 Tax=Fructobacillus parabroussonetiae TaxID=2713174 RepID=UPI00200AD010|nr:phage tail tip lysozyme [Fructobacillus parabroussonetiae]MCK8617045.1 phage tail-type lysozyme domain-containing protein [Fructobacillus parabroussonetiae]
MQKMGKTIGKVSFVIRHFWLFIPLFFLGALLLIVMVVGVSNSNNSCNSANIQVTSTADQKAMAKSIHDNLKNIEGVTEAGICAYLGNSQVESGLNASAIQSGRSYDEQKAHSPSVSGYAFGFNQWETRLAFDNIYYVK